MAKFEHRDITDMFETDWEADRDNRDDSYDDLRFLAGDQWDSRARAERELAKRPLVTINRMGQFVRQVTGDMRLNPTSIDVLPVDDEDDIEKAEIYEGLIRQIEYQSMATLVYAHAFECSTGIGIGHFRINTRYCEDSVDEQEICIERIMNPLSVLWDASSVKIDRSDAKHCFVTDLVTQAEFKKRWPDATISDFPRSGMASDLYWSNANTVRVAEFWNMAPYQRTLAKMRDGSTLDLTGISKAKRAYLPPIAAERTFTDYKVEQYLISGSEILKDASPWAGKYIPIVPAIGSEIPLDEKVVRHGIIRWAKDPQRLYNYYRSSQSELIGQQARAPWILTPEMIKGFEALWNNANTNPRPWLPYNEAKNGNKPERSQPPAASTALWQEAAIASDDMKSTTGIYDASLGQRSNETSGKAIMARQREGDVGSYHYFDNFKASIKRAGDILIDLAPKIYDTERVVRILGKEDDQPSYKTVNQVNAVGETLNDLSVGKFDVRVTAGPSFTTKREEAREGMKEILQANPQLFGIAGDLIIKALDWPFAQEIAERIKRTIPPNITASEEELQQMQNQPPPSDPFQEALKQTAVRTATANADKAEADAANTEANVAKTHAQTMQILVETGADERVAQDKIDLELAANIDTLDHKTMVATMPPQPDPNAAPQPA